MAQPVSGARTAGLRARLRAGERLTGTFLKIAEVTVVEVLADSPLDFVAIDTEHAGWDRGRMDACLAIARARDLPVLVRVIDGAPAPILAALDAGAVGIIVPHVDSVEKARAIARAAHFGEGGRGFAGSTRWAGFATRPMAEVLAQDAETIVIAQIEEPAGLEACEAIAAVADIDALFAGPADLTVAAGGTVLGGPVLDAALGRIGAAARGAGKVSATWVPDQATAAAWAHHGMTLWVVGSDHGFLRIGARAALPG